MEMIVRIAASSWLFPRCEPLRPAALRRRHRTEPAPRLDSMA